MSLYDTFECKISTIQEIEYKDDSDEVQNLIAGSSAPLIIRNFKKDWPIVKASIEGSDSFFKYISSFDVGADIIACIKNQDDDGRYFYNDDYTGFNFESRQIPLKEFLSILANEQYNPTSPQMYSGSNLSNILDDKFLTQHTLDIIPSNVEPRFWIGNQSRVAPHFDYSDNIAVNVAGERTFLLFPPSELSNLYIGSLFQTVAGVPTSIVDPRAVNESRFPKYENALKNAKIATLKAGDAIYIPFLWWHYVEGKTSLNMLVNYWYNKRDMGEVIDCLLMSLLKIRDLPSDDRSAIRNLFDHYIFSQDVDAAVSHLPKHLRYPFEPQSRERDQQLINHLKDQIGKM